MTNSKKNIFKRYNEFMIEGIYIKRNFKSVIDSLILTYNQSEIKSKYYSEFWNRRKTENNDSIVYEILREFNSRKFDEKKLNYENQFVNDTLVDLLKIEFTRGSLNAKKIETGFHTLKKYGLHQSAYNLLFKRPENYKVLLEREKLKNELTKATEFTYPWLMDKKK